MQGSEKQMIMRPQDVAILLKKITPFGQKLNGKELAASLNISPAEISMAMERNRLAQLVDQSKTYVNVLSLREFLVYGVKYCFPARPGRIVRGIPTASSAPCMSEVITPSDEKFVWKDSNGSVRGQSISPLFENIVKGVITDPDYYALLAAVDSIRIGKSRERQAAIVILDKYINSYVREN